MRKLAFVGLVALVVGFVGLMIGAGMNSHSAPASMTNSDSTQLQQEKLRQEILQLEISNNQASGPQRTLLAWAPFVTALGAIAAVGATLWRQTTDLDAARTQLGTEHEKTRIGNEQWREQFLEDQTKNRQQGEQESLRRFDTSLTSVISNLGSGSETLQVNAAAALATFLKPRYAVFHEDLLVVLAANLRLRPTEAVARVLRSDLERLLRLMLRDPTSYGDAMPGELDLSRASLRRFDVTGVNFGTLVMDVAFADLSQARLADARLFRLRGREVVLERAYCSRSNLGEARLDGANCRGVVLHDANLISASLKDADLTGAQLQGASLQEAHFERSNLRGADFTGCDVANAFFRGASFDKVSIRTMARGSKRWRNNRNFDDETRQAVEQAALGLGSA